MVPPGPKACREAGAKVRQDFRPAALGLSEVTVIRKSIGIPGVGAGRPCQRAPLPVRVPCVARGLGRGIAPGPPAADAAADRGAADNAEESAERGADAVADARAELSAEVAPDLAAEIAGCLCYSEA